MGEPDIVEPGGARRRVSGWLLLGIIMAPLVFAWFLLRPGYSTSIRIAAFAYGLMGPVMVLLSAFG